MRLSFTEERTRWSTFLKKPRKKACFPDIFHLSLFPLLL